MVFRRLLRKRWVLGVVFGLSLIYFLTSTLKQVCYVCERKDLLVNGCCNVNAPSSSQYVCKSCLANGCCSVYEYCVSCCLQPDKQPLLERFLNQAAISFQNLFTSVEDHFELCLAKCRTSSQSVQHENTYRNSQAKYCYGESPPELLPI
ncbi:hypothetical protein cypCar_00006566 [Cyprinus carpio]|nr:hypothetical protein cypCar_00006566 [Cyprinus carpio]